jgi:hypothetical protein
MHNALYAMNTNTRPARARTIFAHVLACLAAASPALSAADPPPYPVLATAKTRANPQALAALQKPGRVIFTDGFESKKSLKNYFEIRGLKDGRAKLVLDPKLARSGKGCIQFTAPDRNGKQSGAGASYWFGPEGYDTIYFRRYIRFAPDYDQGNLNHTGGGLAAVAGTGKWDGMGKAGIRPDGTDRFTSGFEPWRDWKRYPSPGFMFLYTYWMDMKRDRDGHYWGNNMYPAKDERFVPKRDRWYCLEQMIKANTPGKADGELAAWIDGKLYIHYTGFRWRTTGKVKLKRTNIGVYIHQCTQDNTVWYDDVALSTGYIGPAKNTAR